MDVFAPSFYCFMDIVPMLVAFPRVLIFIAYIVFAEIHGRYWKVMASAACLWRNRATGFVIDLAASDSSFCCCNALDNSGPL